MITRQKKSQSSIKKKKNLEWEDGKQKKSPLPAHVLSHGNIAQQRGTTLPRVREVWLHR